MTTTVGKWRLTDALTVLIATTSVAGGIVLIVDSSLNTQVQLTAVRAIRPLPWWGAAFLVVGVLAAGWRPAPRIGLWGLRLFTVVASFIALCNIFEAITLAGRPGLQLGWLATILWTFPAVTAALVIRSAEQRP